MIPSRPRQSGQQQTLKGRQQEISTPSTLRTRAAPTADTTHRPQPVSHRRLSRWTSQRGNVSILQHASVDITQARAYSTHDIPVIGQDVAAP